MDKRAKPPIEDERMVEISKKKTPKEQPAWVKGTIEPTTKK